MKSYLRKPAAMLLTGTFVLAAVAVAAHSASGQSTDVSSAQLIGDTDAVWFLVRRNGDYKLAVKAPEAPWRRVGAGMTGNVAAAAGVGESLVVFFAGGGHMRYFPHRPAGVPGIKPPGDLWPPGAKVLAACAAGDGTGAVLVLIARPAGGKPAAIQPTTATKPRELILLQYADQQWQRIAAVPLEPAGMPLRAHLAACRRTTYVMLEQPKAILAAFEKGQWRRIALPDELVRAKPLAMTVINETLVPAGFVPETGSVNIARLESGKWNKPAGIRRAGELLTWPAEAPPTVGKFAQRLALAWPENDKWLFATCGLDGQMSQTSPLDVFARAGAQELAGRVQNIFLWAVLGLTIVLMFWPGQALRMAPFSLPPTMLPAKLSKRLVAACIDMLPFLLIVGAFALKGVDVESVATIDQARDLASSDRFLYALLGFLVIYPAYCFVMEYRFGATLGKIAMGLRVVRDGGQPPSLREAALRNVSKIVELMGLWLIFPLLFPILTRYRQRLGDKISWTAVIDAELSLPPAPPPDPGKDKDNSTGQDDGNMTEKP